MGSLTSPRSRRAGVAAAALALGLSSTPAAGAAPAAPAPPPPPLGCYLDLSQSAAIVCGGLRIDAYPILAGMVGLGAGGLLLSALGSMGDTESMGGTGSSKGTGSIGGPLVPSSAPRPSTSTTTAPPVTTTTTAPPVVVTTSVEPTTTTITPAPVTVVAPPVTVTTTAPAVTVTTTPAMSTTTATPQTTTVAGPTSTVTTTAPGETTTTTPPVVTVTAVPVTTTTTPTVTETTTTTVTSTTTTTRLGHYAALGDSYSSGAGIQPLVPGAPDLCSRSTLNVGERLNAALGPLEFTDVACSGAVSADITNANASNLPPQLDAVRPDTQLVTLTIGGNDQGVFTNTVQGCAQAAFSAQNYGGNPCEQRYGTSFTDIIRNQTAPNVKAAVAAIRAKAPGARILVSGYPRIVPEHPDNSCQSAMPFAMGDFAYVANVEATMNSEVSKAAQDAGAEFVDMTGPSAGHDACQAPSTRWIEPLRGNVNAAVVHPNAAGEQAMADAVLARYRP